MRKKIAIILGFLLIILFVSIFIYMEFSIEWEKDKFLGEWADPSLIGDNWAFFPDRSFAIQSSDIWQYGGNYTINGEKLIIDMPGDRGVEEYYYLFSNDNKTLTLYLEEPPTEVYRVYQKSVD